jgi:hypothetical protein
MHDSCLGIKLNHIDRTYRPNDIVEGYIVVNAKKGWKHSGLKMVAMGTVVMVADSRAGFSTTIPPTIILTESQELVGPGSFPNGETKVPFSFKLSTPLNMELIESYHGSHINVIYTIKTSCERGVTYKPLVSEMEFVVETLPKSGSKVAQVTASADQPIEINITPETLSGVSSDQVHKLSKFAIVGKFHRTINPITQPFTGELTVQSAPVPIKSLELQLGRKESISVGSTKFRAITEVQCIQIADGAVACNMVIPIYMIYPRLFTCPTYTDDEDFKIEWQISVVTSFEDGYVVTESYPIELRR